MALRDWIPGGRVKQTGDTRPAVGGLFELPNMRDAGKARSAAALLEAYSTSPRLRAVVSKIAYEVATTEWLALRETRQGRQRNARRFVKRATGEKRRERVATCVKQGDLEPVEESPLLDFLEAGNELQGGTAVFQSTQIHVDLVGDGFWVLELDRAGRPVEAWPIPPSWVKQVPKPGGSNVFKIAAPGTGLEREIPAEAIVWFSDPDPRNPWGRGSGLGASLWDEIQTDELAAKFMRSVFGNSARPDMIISLEGGEKDEAEALKQGWLNSFRGWWNQGKPLFTPRKVGVERISQTFEELQLQSLRSFERDFILQVYGVPPEKLGIIENSNRATIQAADFTFAKNVLMPRIERLRNVLQEHLVPRFDERLVLDFVSPVEADRDFQLKVMQAQPAAFQVDDFRERADFEPLEEGGDKRLVPLNLVELEHLEAIRKGRSLPARTKQDEIDVDVEGLLAEIRGSDLLEAITPGVREMAAETAEQTAREAGTRLTIDPDANRIIRDFLENEAAERMARVSDTTKADVRATLIEGLDARESTQQLAARVSEVFERASTARALAVARTETVAAGTVGSEAAMAETGVEEKQWLSSRDGIVRDAHTGLDGDHVPLGQNFTDPNGATGPGPGRMSTARSSANCRCATIPWFPDERSLMATEEKATAVWKTRESIRLPIERQVRSSVRAAFKKQESAVLAKLRRDAG